MRCQLTSAAALSALALLTGCARLAHRETTSPRVLLEVFVVTADSVDHSIRYVRRNTALSMHSPDPDVVARELLGSFGTPSMLHSTSWRRENDGTVVLTYLAFCEPAQFRAPRPTYVAWSGLSAPPATDPLHPRPPEIREIDVLTHGLRHLSFLVRFSRDGRLPAALSAQSQSFFRAMCGQLAGRVESISKFEECTAVEAR